MTQGQSVKSVADISTEHIHDFFDKLLRQIEEDKNSMLLGTANKEKAEMYEKFITGDKKAIAEMQYKQYSYSIITEMFYNYVTELNKKPEHLPQKLAITFDTNSIHVFAIIKNKDKEASQNLILSESSIIPSYFPKGFKMSTMIYKDTDNVDIPKGYKEFDFSLLKK